MSVALLPPVACACRRRAQRRERPFLKAERRRLCPLLRHVCAQNAAEVSPAVRACLARALEARAACGAALTTHEAHLQLELGRAEWDIAE